MVWIALQFPKVQTFIISKITSNLSAKLKVPVRIAKVDIDFFKTVVLEGVYIEDRHKDTLLYAGKLKANIGLLSLANHSINIDYIGLENAKINLNKKKDSTDFNYAFIINAFASDTTVKDTLSSGWDFDMSDVGLKEIQLSYYDYSAKTDLNLSFKDLDVSIETLGLKDQNMKVEHIFIDQLNLKYNMISSIETIDSLAIATKENIIDDTVTSNKNNFKLSIDDISIKKSFIVFNNENFFNQKKCIDFNHLNISDLNASLADLAMNGNDFKGEIEKFKFKEQSGFILDNFAVAGNFTDTKLHVELNEFLTPNSNLEDKITVDIANLSNIQKEIGNIALNADFDNAVFSMKDVIFFAPNLDSITALKNSSLTINGQLQGKVNNLQFSNAEIALDKNNFIAGNFFIKGLPDINQLAFNVKVNELKANGPYIASLLPKGQSVNLAALGNLNIKLNAVGNLKKFKVDSKINTTVGFAGFNLNVALDNKFFPVALSGNVSTDKFNLGKLLGEKTKLGPLTMYAKINSKGKEVCNFESKIHSLLYNSYNYHDIKIEGTYTNKIANAEIAILDSNLNILLDGYFDFKKSPYLYDFTAKIKNVDLHKLHFYTTPLKLATNIEMHAQGSNIDSIRGKLLISDFMIMNEKVEYTLDTLKALADYHKGYKSINIVSPIINADVKGHFNYSEVPLAVQHLMSHYMAAFKPAGKPVHIDSIICNIKIGDTKGITKIFAPAISELKDIEIIGSFYKASHKLQMNGKVGQIAFNDQKVDKIIFGITGDEEKLNINLGSNTINLSPQVKFHSPSFKGIFSHDALSFNMGMKDTSSTSRLNLDGNLSYRGDTLKLALPKAAIVLRGHEWNLSREANLVYAPKYLMIKNLNLSSGEQLISINTSGEKSNNSTLIANLQKVQLGDISKLIGMKISLEGLINGSTQISNVMGGMGIKSNIDIANIQVDKRPLGNLSINATKNENKGLLDLKTALSGAGNEIIVAGSYNMDKQVDNMDFKINIDNLNMQDIQPFVKDLFYTLNGKLQAKLLLVGSPSSPELTGKISFKNTHTIGITAIQTPYKIINQEIIFNHKSIQLNNFKILDTSNQVANINGFIYHEKMQNFSTDLSFDAKNFQFINSENSAAPVFGKFIADLNVKVNGPIENLDVKLNVLTKPKTNLSLNIASQQVLSGRPKYIKFTSFYTDSSGYKKYILDTNALSLLPQVDMSRFKISGFINVTKDANFNIIINPITGDKIVAKGDGKFRMNFDSNNDINLFGQFIIDKGTYGLSFLGVVNREFKIDRGSSINFYGNPQEGEMDIKAIYTTKVSRYDLISDLGLPQNEENTAKLKAPVDLYLILKGGFLKPQITFDIIVPESKRGMSAVATRIEQIKNDESQLNKQVFGLLVMNKFFPYEGGASSKSGGGMNESATETVGTLVADQLNRLSADYIEGVSIEVNTETQSDIDNNVSNNVSIMASKQISDRLKVGVGGKSNIGNNGNAQGIAGEYEIVYSLNQSGSASIKLFSTSQQNIYTSTNNQVSGVSINHSKGFDKVKDIFKKEDSR